MYLRWFVRRLPFLDDLLGRVRRAPGKLNRRLPVPGERLVVLRLNLIADLAHMDMLALELGWKSLVRNYLAVLDCAAIYRKAMLGRIQESSLRWEMHCHPSALVEPDYNYHKLVAVVLDRRRDTRVERTVDRQPDIQLVEMPVDRRLMAVMGLAGKLVGVPTVQVMPDACVE